MWKKLLCKVIGHKVPWMMGRHWALSRYCVRCKGTVGDW